MPKAEKQKPNFKQSGLLAADALSKNGTVLKYVEPRDARVPNMGRWRLFVFKNNDVIDSFALGSQSAYLFGRDRKVCDIPIDHQSCSKQHSVIQFRGVEDGTVKPYVIDLDSTNGTRLNKTKISGRRYYELRSQDLINFGDSTRDYVLMDESVVASKDSDNDQHKEA